MGAMVNSRSHLYMILICVLHLFFVMLFIYVHHLNNAL